MGISVPIVLIVVVVVIIVCCCCKKKGEDEKKEDRKSKYAVNDKGGQPPETDMEMNPKDGKSNRSNGPDAYKDFEASP